MLTAKSEDTKTILGIMTILSGNFIDLYRAKTALNAGVSQETAAEAFGYPKNRAFVMKNAYRDCRNMGTAQLRTCIRILRDTDKACKSSRTPPRILLEQAIVRMLRVDKNGNAF
jgi:DNA polymerase-3 subunit delta